MKRSFDGLKIRGPDNTTYYRLHSNLSDTDLHIGFHRLSINDVTEAVIPLLRKASILFVMGRYIIFSLLLKSLILI